MFLLRSISAYLLYMKCSFCRFYLGYEVRKDAQSAGKTTGVDKILFEMDTDCLFRYFGYVKILEVSKTILTQMEISCCPVAVKLGVQPYIFAVHLKSFRVEVYRLLSFSLFVFLVTFLETFLCSLWKHIGIVLIS